MLCQSCGKEIDVVAKVCPYCGIPVASSGGFQSVSYGKEGIRMKIMCAVVAVLHVVQIILWFTPYITVSLGGRSIISQSLVDVNSGDHAPPFTPIFIIIFALGAIFAILPVFTGIMKKRRRMIISKIISVICILFVWLMAGIFDSGSYHVEWSLTFTGWLFVLTPIAIFVLTVLVSRTSKGVLKKSQ